MKKNQEPKTKEFDGSEYGGHKGDKFKLTIERIPISPKLYISSPKEEVEGRLKKDSTRRKKELIIEIPASKEKEIQRKVVPYSPVNQKTDVELIEEWLKTPQTEIDEKRKSLLIANAVAGEKSIDKLILESSSEVNRIFEVIKHKGWGRLNINDLRKKRALDFYDKHKAEIHLIKREMLDDDSIYKLSDKMEKPVFRQKLIKKVILYWLNYEIQIDPLRRKISELL